MSTAAETLAHLAEHHRKLAIHLSANVQPFMDSMFRIVAAFNGLAEAMKPTIDRVAAFSKRWAPPAEPGPFRVKRGRGQRRNRRNAR